VAILAKVVRLASIAICLLAVASFLLFVLNQTSTASGQQQEVVNPRAPSTQSATATGAGAAAAAPAGATGTGAGAPTRESGVRKQLDEASEALSSPVSGVASSSEWSTRAVRLLFALLVYGFGLGYVARVMRVRA
jgi:cobalamin biosynthesis Mg chelatase CobN